MASTKITTKTTTSQGLGTVQSLFSESWDLFKKSWSQQFALGVIVSFLSFFVVLLAVIVFAVINVPQLPSIITAIQNNGEGIQTLLPIILTSAGLVFGVMAVVLWLVGIAYAAGMLILVNSVYKGQKMSFSQALKAGLSKAGPMVAMGIVAGFLVLGGYWLLVIPGLIMALYLSYSTFEVALANQKPLDAMRQSIRIVGSNFWGIFGRLFLLGLAFELLIIASAIFGGSLSRYNLDGIWSIVNLVLQYALQFFAVAYAIVLYGRSKEASVGAKPTSLKLMVIVSVAGWIFAAVVGSALISGLKTALPMIEDSIRQAEQQKSEQYMLDQSHNPDQSYDMEQSDVMDETDSMDETDADSTDAYKMYMDYLNSAENADTTTVYPDASPMLYRQ